METRHSLRPSRWDCQYHGVWIPKCRKKKRYGRLRSELGAVFHALADQQECRVLEGDLLLDHVPMLISIPPK
jgi:putative transposase